MRWHEPAPMQPEFPGRYTLDEARFTGGKDRSRSKEDDKHEPHADFT